MKPTNCTNHINQQLKKCIHSRFALSTVVTTLIVLVISVLLAGVVTYFAINVTSTRVQEESLDLAKQHVWFDFATSKTQAAIMIINSGGRDVVIDKLTVRGQQCSWSNVYFNQTTASISGDLSYASSLSDGTSLSIGSTNFIFKQATNDLTVQSGKTLMIYITSPDSISVNDIGLTVSVNIFTSQAMYYKETNVQGTSGTTTTSLPGALEPGDFDGVAYAEITNQGSVAIAFSNAASTALTFSYDSVVVEGSTYESSKMYVWLGTTPITNDLPHFSALVEGSSTVVQTYTLTDQTASTITVQPGQNIIVYFCHFTPGANTYFTIGNEISVGIEFDGGLLTIDTVVTVKSTNS